MGSELAPHQRRAIDADQTVDVLAPVKDARSQGSKARQEDARNPAWLVLEILFITVLVFFWL